VEVIFEARRGRKLIERDKWILIGQSEGSIRGINLALIGHKSSKGFSASPGMQIKNEIKIVSRGQLYLLT